MMVVSYNPGYQSVRKNLKQSTKQRFIAWTSPTRRRTRSG